MPKRIESHYDWLFKHLPTIIQNLGLRDSIMGAIVGDGDKCWSWQDQWKEAGIPFPHGVAMYILSKTRPWSEEVRETKTGWVPVYDWIVNNYSRFKEHFPTEDLDNGRDRW